MFPYQYNVFCFVTVIIISASAQYSDGLSKYLSYHQPDSMPRANPGNLNYMQEKVRIKLYYESLCPDCRVFDAKQFAPVVKKLGAYLDVHVYPYGNARTVINENGKLEIICQHGPAECYGNMLHACTIDILKNLTAAIEFNSCMMDEHQANYGSDDLAADKCGVLLNVVSEPIKSCAKSPRGFALLKYYGTLSKQASFRAVPHILINGVQNDGNNFMHDVCAAFQNPPDECNEM